MFNFSLKKTSDFLSKKCTFTAPIVRTACGHRAWFLCIVLILCVLEGRKIKKTAKIENSFKYKNVQFFLRPEANKISLKL